MILFCFGPFVDVENDPRHVRVSLAEGPGLASINGL